MQYGWMFDRGQRSGSGFSTERVRWLNLNSEPRTLNPLLIRYRPFENRDPPGLAEIWRSQRPIRGRIQSVTPQLIEEHVLAKPWFDRHGLIVACEGARPVGFVHAGFGADCSQCGVDCNEGTTCLLLVAPHSDRPMIAAELLGASEDYLRRRGAKQLFAGSQFPLNPFYLGMYGSSDVAGILSSNTGLVHLLANSGYQPKIRRVLAGRTLAGFRPPVDRKQMQVRRKFKVAEPAYVVPDNWWEACVWALHEWTRYKLVLPGGGEPIISATFWDVEPLGHNWGVQTVGLVKLDDTPEAREAGLTTYLLAEALRQFQSAGYAQFEAQSAATDESLRAVFAELGLAEYDEGVLWAKA
jgi:GNAT superfamily N-acetyltransferase